MDRFAFTGARIFDGEEWHERTRRWSSATGSSKASMAADSPPMPDASRSMAACWCPASSTCRSMAAAACCSTTSRPSRRIGTICRTFYQFGTTALLPTLITDTPEVTGRAIDAGVEAARRETPGFLGLHLEGPHLSLARKGAHDPALIRPMEEADLRRLVDARAKLPNLLTTVAPETVTPEQIAALAAAGIVVSIGHSDARYAIATTAAAAGASMVTHLFNALSQLGNREPGVVGAALDTGTLWAGLIADGIHVHDAAIGIALRAKRGAGQDLPRHRRDVDDRPPSRASPSTAA